MGRTVVAEEAIKSSATGTGTSEKLHTGLLVGQVGDGRDLIGLAVSTPSLQDFSAGEDGGGGQSGEDTFIDWWVVEHASQVTNMLPGGLGVVGVFVCCQALQPLQARLAKVLTGIAAGQEFKGHQPHQHLCLLHYCPVKKRFKCQTIDTADPQAGFKPAELKFAAHMNHWSKIEAVVSVDTECFIPGPVEGQGGKKEGEEGEEESKKMVHAQARAGIGELLESLQSAVVTLRGHTVRDGSKSLVKSSSKKSQSSPETVQAALFLRRPPVPSTPSTSADRDPTLSSPPTTIPSARRVCLRGDLSVVAYVHPKATCAEAIAAVKQDACRSLVSRVQAMVESKAMSEQLPVRVALSASPWHCDITEYSLPHEDIQECASRAGDLFGAAVDAITATPLEQFPEKNGGRAEDSVTAEEEEYKNVLTHYYGFASIFASISVILIAVSVWIMLQ